MTKVEWEYLDIEKITKEKDQFKIYDKRFSSKDKYYKIVWFAKLELAEKYAKKVDHTQKIMVLEDVDYRDKKLKTDVRYQQLMFGVRVKYMKDFKAQLPKNH